MPDTTISESSRGSQRDDEPWPVIMLGCLFVMMGVSTWVQVGFEIFSPTDIGDRGSGMFFLRSLVSLGLPSAFIILGKGLIEGSAKCFDWSRVVLWLALVVCCLHVVLAVYMAFSSASKGDATTIQPAIFSNWWMHLLIFFSIAVFVRWAIKQLDRWQPPEDYKGASIRLWFCVALASVLVFLPLISKSNSLKKKMHSMKATRVMITAVDSQSDAPLSNLEVDPEDLGLRDFHQIASSKPVGEVKQAVVELRWISDKPETWWVESRGYKKQKIVIQHQKEIKARLIKADVDKP
jgi:surface polysaccharide O-acyltransferase-like enzyme